MSYVIGNLIGRFIISYVLIGLVWWVVCRFDRRRAWGYARKWYSWLGAGVLVLLGLGAAFSQIGGAG